MYINYIQDFLRLTKENTKSTRYTSEVRIHIEANPPYAAAWSFNPNPKSYLKLAAVFAPTLKYKVNPQRPNNIPC